MPILSGGGGAAQREEHPAASQRAVLAVESASVAAAVASAGDGQVAAGARVDVEPIRSGQSAREPPSPPKSNPTSVLQRRQ